MDSRGNKKKKENETKNNSDCCPRVQKVPLHSVTAICVQPLKLLPLITFVFLQISIKKKKEILS